MPAPQLHWAAWLTAIEGRQANDTDSSQAGQFANQLLLVILTRGSYVPI